MVDFSARYHHNSLVSKSGLACLDTVWEGGESRNDVRSCVSRMIANMSDFLAHLRTQESSAEKANL